MANLSARSRIRREAQGDRAYQRRLKAMCAEDPLFYINLFAWTFAPFQDPNELPLITYDYQDELVLKLLEHIHKQRPINIKKSRDMGVSWTVLAVFRWLMKFRHRMTLGCMSWKEDFVDKTGSTDSLFWKLDFLYENEPVWMRERRVRNSMHWENEETLGVLDGETSNPNAFRAGRRLAIAWDESTSTPNAFEVAQGMAKATACMIRIYTSKGAQTESASLERAGVYTHKLHWTLHPLHARGLYRIEGGKAVVLDAKPFVHWDANLNAVNFPADYKFVVDGQTVHEGQLRSPWYDQSCQEFHWIPALIASELDMNDEVASSQFFDTAFLDRVEHEYCIGPVRSGRVEFSNVSCTPKEFVTQDGGPLKLWIHLPFGVPARDRTYTIGADTSQGRGASNSVLAITDDRTKEKIGEYANPYLMPHEFAREAAAVGRFFKGADARPAQIIAESFGPGDTFLQCLIDLGYENIWYPPGETVKPGWQPTKRAKLQLLGEYRGAQMDAKYIDRSKECVTEQRKYVISQDGTVSYKDSCGFMDASGAGSNHGDRVMATALSYYGSKERSDVPSESSAVFEEGSRGWRNERRREKEMRRETATYWEAQALVS